VPLSAFAGKSSIGTWGLLVADFYNGDIGDIGAIRVEIMEILSPGATKKRAIYSRNNCLWHKELFDHKHARKCLFSKEKRCFWTFKNLRKK
jgi:subtilisin-like proprotein convertase family protein